MLAMETSPSDYRDPPADQSLAPPVADPPGDVPSDGDADIPETEDDGAGAAPGRRFARWRKRPDFLGAAITAFGLLAAAITAAGLGIGSPASSDSETVELAAGSVFHALPTVVTDLQPGPHRPHYIKLDVVLEVGADSVPHIQVREAAILDSMRAILRDYHRSDLVGTAGARRLRSDLIAVVDAELQPERTRGLLFKQFVLD